MKRSKECVYFILLGFLSLFMSSMSCSTNGEAKDKEKDAGKNVFIPVEVAQVTNSPISAYLTGTATIETEEEAEVVAKTSGIVEQILVEEGTWVKKGQVLAQLEKDMLAIEMERARADLDRLENDFQRSEELFDKKLISKEEFQAKGFEYQAQSAAYKQAELNVEYASIRAPINGIVASRYIKTGNMIGQNDPAFKIVDFDHLIANLFVPEVDIHKVAIGHKAEVNFDATDGQVFTGNIDRISPIVDPASGTVKVTIALKQQGQQLKPGMFARVKIIYDTHANSLLIPKQAVLTEDNESLVYTIADSIATKKTVKTGYASETMIEIVDGLTLGEQVVVVGQNGLKDSSKVELVQ